LQEDQFLRERSYPIDVAAVLPKVHPNVAAIGPTQARKRLNERRDASLPHVAPHEHADAPYAVALLLRPSRKRPRRRAPEPRDELPPLHWITSSAVASSVSGIVRPRALAILRLITSSNLLGWITGRSAGFSPLRMRPV
jgi:hypothetical protein